MNNRFAGFQTPVGGDFLANIAAQLNSMKTNLTGNLSVDGTAYKLITGTDIVGSISRGESIKYPKLSEIFGGLGGGMGRRMGGKANMGGKNLANKPASATFQRSPPGGNLYTPNRGDLRTASFRRERPGRTRRF